MTRLEIEEKNKILASELLRQVNIMGNEDELARAILAELLSAHRTNQQSFIGILKSVLEDYARTEGTDARNEDSKKWAKQVAKIQDYGFSFI